MKVRVKWRLLPGPEVPGLFVFLRVAAIVLWAAILVASVTVLIAAGLRRWSDLVFVGLAILAAVELWDWGHQ